MQSQTVLFFYKLRFTLAARFTVAFLMLISALVTAIGSNTILAHPSKSTLGISTSNSSNLTIAGANAVAEGAQNIMLTIGNTFFRTCRSITVATDKSGRSIARGSADIAGSIWNGAWHNAEFGAHVTADGITFALNIPGKVLGFIAHEHTVSTLIRPADSTNRSVPVISETSAAALAQFSAQQQQQIAQWQASQLAANRSLEGVVLAGDPEHGEYPARWANAPQDSALDSWGMYNRECVSYTAWKVYQTYGYMPFWGGAGNANEWPGDAVRAGIQTGSMPRVGSVAISTSGYYGHAMWVEKISGNMIYVSQYNYDLNGDYSEMWVAGSHFTYIYFK